MINQDTCKKSRSIINKHLKEAARECGLNFEQIGSMSFSNTELSFRVKMFPKGVDIAEAKADKFMLRIHGFTLKQRVTGIDGKSYTLVGTYRNGFIIQGMNGKQYRCKPEWISAIKIQKALKVGMRVQAPWTDGEFYNGKIHSISGSKCTIHFDDGDSLTVISDTVIPI